MDTSILFTGRQATLLRLNTGLHTLDYAYRDAAGNTGVPVKGILEVSGRKGIGKSTFVDSLAGILAKQLETNISLIDTEEHLALDYLKTILQHQGYGGEVHNVDGKNDAWLLENGLKDLEDAKFCVGILDSVGGVSPVAEEEGHLTDANMGQRAKLMGNFARRVVKVFRYKSLPSILLATNHLHANMGSKGEETSGGIVFRHLTSSRIKLFQKELFDDGSTFLQGKIINSTFGKSGGTFFVFLLSGKGIHTGLTAVYDCIMTGTAKLDKVVKMNGKSFGYMKRMIEQAEDAELFQPFIDALNGSNVDTVSNNAEEEE